MKPQEKVLTGFNGNAGIVHVATDVGEDLGLQPELANSLAVCTPEKNTP